MSNSKNIISTSKKEIYTKLMDIAGKYTDIKNSDFAKTGLFGYITESMAMTLRDSTLHTSMMYNESFLNTAIIPRSVYNWAKMFNIEVQKADPAYAEITFSISASALEANNVGRKLTPSDIERFGRIFNTDAEVENTKVIILDKEDPIIAGDYYFSLEHSIVIYQKTETVNGEPITTYVAEYILTEYESTNYQNISISNNNKSLIVRYNNGNYDIMARAYQYRLNKIDRQLTSTSFLNKVQTYNFDDQFCGAKLFCYNNGAKEEVNLAYSEINLPTDRETAFYNLTSDNELEIIFKYGDDNLFMPGANSNLITYIYTTKGKNVPSTFTGSAVMLISDTTFKTLPITIRFTDTYIVGGKNIPSLSDIKNTIINEISTRNTITTQSDLNNFFQVLTSMISTVNDGKVTFLKQRDDIIRRIYNAYLLLRDNTNDITNQYSGTSFISSCVPTNTIDATASNIISSNNNGIIKIENAEGSSSNTNIISLKYPRFIPSSDGSQWVSVGPEYNGDYYVCPFKIRVMTEPVKTIKYSYDMVNNNVKLNYTKAGTSDFFNSYYMLPVSLSVEKVIGDSGFGSGGTGKDKYIMRMVVTTNFPTINEEGSFPVSGSIMMIPDVGSLNIEFGEGKDARIVESIKNDSVYTSTIEMVLNAEESNVSGKITLSNYDNRSSVTFSSESQLAFNFSSMAFNNGVNTMSLTNLEFRTAQPVAWVKELDDIMESSISVNSNPNGSDYSITIHDIPVIHSSFFNDHNYTQRLNGFTEQLFTYINILKENLNRLETSTFFSLKFYNTYGDSYKYSTPKTNLDLQLRIKLLDAYKDSEITDQLQKEIRSYIRRVVDKSNETGLGLRYSDIITALMQTGAYGNYIEHVLFTGLNSTYSQYVSPIVSTSEYTTDTPEWLNLDSTTINSCILFE